MAFDCLPRALGPPARVGGRLQAFLPAWAAITDDAFVLSVIRGGFSIELADPLPGGVIRLAPPRMPPRMSRGIAAEVHALCIRGVMERAVDHPRLCLPPPPRLFCFQRSKKFRLILNLKRINLHISPSHFRMETLKSILPLFRPGDWTVSIDLKDAYHHVPIAPASRDILGFVVAGNTYRFKALPFGLKPAPRLFTRLVACVAAFLRQQGLRVLILLPGRLAPGGRVPRTTVPPAALPTTDSAGPGAYSKLGEVGAYAFTAPDLPRSRHRSTPPAGAAEPGQGEHDHGGRTTPAPPPAGPGQGVAPFLGYLASLVDVLLDCRLHMHPLQLHLLRHYRPSVDSLTRLVPLPPSIRLLLMQ